MSRRRRLGKKVRDGDVERRRDQRDAIAARASDAILPVADGGLVDVELPRQVLLGEVALDSDLANPHLQNRPIPRLQERPVPLSSLHGWIVESRSTIRQGKTNAVPLSGVQPSEHMGDRLHKKSDPNADEDPVTPQWRAIVKKQLAANREKNRANGLRPRDPSRLIDDYASLARAVDSDTTMMTNILGPVRVGSKPKKLVTSSKFVRPISAALDIPFSSSKRLESVISRMRSLSDEDLRAFELMLDRFNTRQG